jgi:hypothetical protein
MGGSAASRKITYFEVAMAYFFVAGAFVLGACFGWAIGFIVASPSNCFRRQPIGSECCYTGGGSTYY